MADFQDEVGAVNVHIHPRRASRWRIFDLVDGVVQRVHVAILGPRCDTARIMVAERRVGTAVLEALSRSVGGRAG